MSKSATFNGKIGSYGFYGGDKVRGNTANSRGYLQTKCCVLVTDDVVCGRKAIYHTGGEGYCLQHKQDAIKQRLRYRDKLVEKFVAKLDEPTEGPETSTIEGFELVEVPISPNLRSRKNRG